MQPGDEARRSYTLPILATLFLCAYFALFASDGLNAYFTFDDGMNLVYLHRVWDLPIRTNMVDALKVFTAAYRPLGALVYRPLYDLFGFHPLPFRIAAYWLLVFNIVLAYRFSRALEATPETALLTALLVSYNGSMMDLYYNTGTIYDLLCFPLYFGAVLVYARQRSQRGVLPVRTMAAVMLLFLAGLDAKEMAVTLPAALLLYEILYRHADFKWNRASLRTGSFLAVMFAAAAAFLKVKVADMSANTFYHPHLSIPFILSGIGHYIEELFYLRPGSCGPWTVAIAAGALLGCAAAMRNRIAAFGTLLFVTALLPLSVIVHRTGYAAYVAYPGIALAIAAILTSARSALIRISGRKNLERASMVVLFLCVAATSVKCFANTRKILMSNSLWDEQRRIDFLSGLQRRIPEFPPNARVLLVEDPWPSDWGPMFLAQLMYHDRSLWLDRVNNGVETGDRDSYDLLIAYQEPRQRQFQTKILGQRKTWETHWAPLDEGKLVITAPNESRAPRPISFSPPATGPGQPVSATIAGLSGVSLDVICRIRSDGRVTAHTMEGWCTLDAHGTCTITAPQGDGLTVDWVRPAKGRWILATGHLSMSGGSGK